MIRSLRAALAALLSVVLIGAQLAQVSATSLPPVNLLGLTASLPLICDSVAAASYNTTVAQAALDAGGEVRVSRACTYYQNGTLYIGDNTTLARAEGVVFKQAPGIAKSMLRTKASIAAKTTVTITWTAGNDATVSWPNHPMAVGNYAWLAGSNVEQFIGVFPVRSVIDANTFTIKLDKTPTGPPTTTVYAAKANQNINVLGGAWDYDYANQGTPTGVDTQALVMVGVQHLVVNTEGRNAFKYVLTISAARDFQVQRMFIPNTRSDGIKIYGPAYLGRIDLEEGTVGDDFISLQPREATGFLTYPLSEGPISDIKIGDLRQVNKPTSTGVFVVYAGTYSLDNIDVDSVEGDSAYRLVNIRSSGDQTAATVGRITIRKVEGRAATPVWIGASVSNALLTAPNLSIGLHETRLTGDTTANPNNAHVLIDAGAAVGQLIIPYIHFTDSSYGSAASSSFVYVGGQTDKLLILDPFVNVGTAGSGRLVGTGPNQWNGSAFVATTLGQVIIERGDTLISTLVSSFSQSGSPFVGIYRGRHKGLCGFNPRISASFDQRGNIWDNPSNGILRPQNSVSVNYFSGETSIVTGTAFLVVPAGNNPTVYPKSDEIKVDVSATYIGRSQGGAAFNTNAGLGTLGVAGPVRALTGLSGGTTTGWALASDTTKVYAP